MYFFFIVNVFILFINSVSIINFLCNISYSLLFVWKFLNANHTPSFKYYDNSNSLVHLVLLIDYGLLFNILTINIFMKPNLKMI